METLRILLTCPECGNSTWCRHEDEDATGFVCLACGEYCETEDMPAKVQQ